MKHHPLRIPPALIAEIGAAALLVSVIASGLSGTASLLAQTATKPLKIPPTPIKLLEPLGSQTTLPAQPGINIFFTYFNDIWPWVIGSAAGIAVLQGLYGGIQIMMSGGDSSIRSAGKERFMWALAGLLMIGLSGLILETLNPTFFVQV